MRSKEAMRNLVRENSVTPHDLILPIFVEEGLTERTPVEAMPGVYRETEDSLSKILKDAQSHDIQSVILFGVSHHKDHSGSDSMREGGLLDRMVRRAKDTCPDMVIMADVCFCEYTDHGHCGPLTESGGVDNDQTLENIAMQACIAAEAGADIIAPSGMMDGQVAMIRHGLDQSGYEDVAILAYAAKFASAFYGPFRAAAGCALEKGQDRKAYQMDPANTDEALREVALDLEEGADMVMVKPGIAYLDILHQVKQNFKVPTFAYHVSGEYAMLKAASEKGWIDYDAVMMETLLSFKRAGADGILTYASIDAAKLLSA
jgi:porphobilinogen synthase